MGVAVLNIIVAVIILFSLHQSRLQYTDSAVAVTKNITQVLEGNITGIIKEADIALQAVVDEAERQLSSGGIQPQSLNSFISREHSRLPELIALRATDASGNALYGPPATPAKTISLAHRDYFKFLQDTPNTDLVVSKPLIGGISGKWMIVIARRINRPDGSFAGLAYAGISLNYLTQIFSRIDVGPHGTLSLIDSEFTLVARYPESKPESDTIGHKIKSQKLQALIQQGNSTGTYTVNSSVDSLERIYSFRKLSYSAPLYVFVGLATSDVLANWHTDILIMSFFMLLFLVITAALTWLLYSALLRSKEAEQAIVVSEERFRNILQDVPSIAVQGYGPDGTTQYWNQASEKLYGYSAQEAVGQSLLDLIIPPAMRDDVEQAIQYMAETGQPIPASELKLMRKDGSLVPVYSSHTIVQIPGRDQELFCLDIDLTELKQAEEKLANAKIMLEAAFEQSPVPMVLVSMPDAVIRIANSACREFLGIADEPTPVGKQLSDYKPTYREFDANDNLLPLSESPLAQLVLDGIKPTNLERKVVTKDGSVRWGSVNGSTIYNEDGDLIAVYLVFPDITREKLDEKEKEVLEQQLHQAQKLESLGVLAGGIAHDFNNLLTVIIGHCSLARLRPATALDSILPIEKAADRAAVLCQQMLAYAGKSNFTKAHIYLDKLVDELVNLSKSTVGKNIEVTSELAADIPPIMVDAIQIRQVVMNLVINASEAIGSAQGRVHVSLAKREVIDTNHQEKDHFGATIPPGWYACLEVTDTGSGMDDETRQRLFEPFFTTKFTGRGLGMSAVLGIIKGHNGALQLFSQRGQGTTFKVFLPMQRAESAGNQSSQQIIPAALWRGSGTVMLVEDEEPIKCIAQEMLEELGFSVITAANGKEALQRYRQHASEITLIITDIGMPVMDGYALFHEVKSLNPELPIVISSGFGDREVASHIAPDDIAGLISKPYRFDKVQEVLKNVLKCSSK